MAKLDILIAPHPILETPAEKVEKITGEIRTIVSDMIETMYANNGAGLAANQVGVLKRILILDVTSYGIKQDKPYVMINPEVVYSSEETWTEEERCLSFPLVSVNVTRPKNIRVKFLDAEGKERTLEADGWLGRGILHEMDHLSGVTQLDYASPMKKNIMIRKLNKYKKLNKIA
ncbi:MAG: peptide deformylase [Rickettsiales bacterium]